jgi:hypothetical protein
MGCIIVILLILIVIILAGSRLIAFGAILELFSKIDEWTKDWGAMSWFALALGLPSAFLGFVWWILMRPETPGFVPPPKKPIAVLNPDYRKWTKRQWKKWQLHESVEEPLPDDTQKWRPEHWDRYKKQQWLQLLETPPSTAQKSKPKKRAKAKARFKGNRE